MGKDVVTFLSWAAEPEMEERKLVCPQPLSAHPLFTVSIVLRLVFVVPSLPNLLCFVLRNSQMGFKWILVLSLALLQAGYYRRLKWSVFKSRKLVVDVVN